MQWLLVVMISMYWLEADAILGLNSSEVRRILVTSWNDISYGPITLLNAELDYLLGTERGPPLGTPPGRRVECRTLSNEKRQLLWAAFQWAFRETVPDGLMTHYEVFVSQHRKEMAPGAHGGPCFPPWHRNYLLSFERVLQKFNSSVNLCYWDSSLDSSLPNPAHSAVWTADYFGNGDGYVTTGFAANKTTTPLDCATINGGWPRLYRDCGGDNLLFTQDKINSLYARCSSYTEFIKPYTTNDFEGFHGEVHGFVGGLMLIIPCSVNDPVFWFHHSYIDYLWEQCRQRQTTDKQTDYPKDLPIVVVPEFHSASDPMLPYKKKCIEGLSYSYIPGNYSYEPSPFACGTHEDCGGKTLWCNNGICTACVGPNGQMGANWPDAACYFPNCATPRKVNGVCKCAP